MKCQDLMTLDVRWIRDMATVQEAAVAMRDNSIGFLPVCDGEGNLVGVVTDRDLATRATADNRVPAATPVSQVMSSPPIVCLEEEPVQRAEEVMAESQLTRLPVLGPNNRLVGVISLADIVTRRRDGEALRTARGVLARDSAGPHPPIEGIHLTPSEPGGQAPSGGFVNDYSRTREEGRSVAIGRWPGVR
jgi:CBS domain-containing protein